MIDTVVGALLPVVVTLLFGALAGWLHDADQKVATALNMVVLHYALPAALFVGTVSTPRDTLLQQWPLALVLLAGMAVPFAGTCLVMRHVLHRSLGVAALRAMGYGLPAIPFTGIPILSPLLGQQAVIVVAVGACVINIVIVPATLLLIELDGNKGGDGAPGVLSVLGKALLQPIVVAPVVGLVAVFSGLKVPSLALDGFRLLASSVGGVSLFASGLVLQGQKPALSWPASLLTFARNMLIPGITFVALRALGVNGGLVKASVLALALPAGPMQITLAMRYEADKQEQASYLLFSSLLSVLTIALFIVLFG